MKLLGFRKEQEKNDMSYSLSFSEEFFTDKTYPYETKPSERPTTVYQAIISLRKHELMAIAKDVLKCKHPYLEVTAEDFAGKVLDKVRETNTCSDIFSRSGTPVSVWIDPEGWYTVEVYE
jgi:hypothetical protein